MNPVLVNVMFCPKGTTSEEKIEKRWKKPNWTQGTCRSLWSSINNQIFWFLFHMTQAMFFWYCRKKGFINCSETSSIRDNQTSTAVSRPPRHLPTLFVLREHFQHVQFTSPFLLSFFLFFILYTRQDLAKLIFHLFHIISNPKFNVHTKYYYFISWPSLHFLIKGHNLFNLSLPFLLKTKNITILI